MAQTDTKAETMVMGSILIVDADPQRRAAACERLRVHRYNPIQASSADDALAKAQQQKPDLILLRLSSGVELFLKLAPVAELSGALIVPFIERSFSPERRREILMLNAAGFINDESPTDEWLASIHALLRQKRTLDELKQASDLPNTGDRPRDTMAPLRERSPDLYQAVLCNYEEAIKKVLQHRIYKMNDDVFEPFRQIAKQLFLANATARDAVELHYQTLRKIAPTPDSPRAHAYLEVGRTTIIGLMGDLLTYYRDARRNETTNAKSYLNAPAEPRTEHALK